jgi:predicted esterase
MQRAWLGLWCLAACGVEPAVERLPSEAAPVPPTFRVSPVGLTGHVKFDLLNAVPGERVSIARGQQGAGPCPPALGGECLDLVNPVVMTRITVASDGTGTATLGVPDLPQLNGATACFQAVVVRGVGGVDTELSTVRCVPVGYDSDDDLVLDSNDLCAGFDDFFDWDLDGVPDGCDRAIDRPPVFVEAAPNGPVLTRTFQQRSVVQRIGSGALGVVFAFHGSGGGSDFVTTPEMTVLFNALADVGIGYVAVSSEVRSPAAWDDVRAQASNPDWQRVLALRADLISRGDITSTTKVFVLGFSGGGPMAAYTASAGQAAGWPVRGGVLMATFGRSDRFGDPPALPFVFVAAENDDVVTSATMQSRYQSHLSQGGSGLFVEVAEERLAPTRFARSTYFDEADSLDLFKLVVERGYYDKRGVRTFSTASIEANIDDIIALPGFSPSPPGKAVLQVVHAVHALNAGASTQVATVLEAAL